MQQVNRDLESAIPALKQYFSAKLDCRVVQLSMFIYLFDAKYSAWNSQVHWLCTV